MNPVIKFRKLPHFNGDLPAYQTAGSAGCDVQAALDSSGGLLLIKPGARALVPTGLTLEIPRGFEIQVRPRSGLALKNGVTVLNTPGTIDSDYRGEVKVLMINLGQEDFTIKNGDRIAQLVLSPVVHALFQEAGELEATSRGEAGFGSTGVERP